MNLDVGMFFYGIAVMLLTVHVIAVVVIRFDKSVMDMDRIYIYTGFQIYLALVILLGYMHHTQ